MYSSLNKIDIVLDDAGRKVAVQTDHREAAEIDRDWEVSAAFAAARAVNPRRAGGCGAVRFAMMHRPSDRYLELCAALGAEVEIVPEQRTMAAAPDEARALAIVGEALRALGTRLLARRGLGDDEAGIVKLQEEYAMRAGAAGGVEEDEIGHWTAVVELAAGVGEVLCRRYGTTWGSDPEFFAMIPLVLVDGEARTNVFGKVERYFEEGPSEAPAKLFTMLADHGAQLQGPVMFNLRPADWAGRDRALVLPRLLENLPDGDQPVLVLVRDLPNTVATLPAATSPEEVAVLRAEAESNLAAHSVEVAEVDAPMPLLVVGGSYYACEKILDPAFMGTLHARLSSKLLAAGIPAKGQLWVTTALTEPAQVGVFAMLVRRRHEDSPPNERLSTEVFLISDGTVVGVARGGAPQQPEDNKPKKGFWARLFGR